jgi:mRNA-degrading endonuclease RelE of RelBE toxin-antitoxin system
MGGWFKGAKRKRKGEYPIIYDVDEGNNIIIILDIGKRNNIYKKK